MAIATVLSRAPWDRRTPGPSRGGHQQQTADVQAGGPAGGRCERKQGSGASRDHQFEFLIPAGTSHRQSGARRPAKGRRPIRSSHRRRDSYCHRAAVDCDRLADRLRILRRAVPERRIAFRKRCAAHQVRRYRARISGPLLDRLDLHLSVPRVEFKSLHEPSGNNGTSARSRFGQGAREICR